MGGGTVIDDYIQVNDRLNAAWKVIHDLNERVKSLETEVEICKRVNDLLAKCK